MRGFSFSLRRALGISAAQGRLSRAIGIPLSKGGRQRKIGRLTAGSIASLFVEAGATAMKAGARSARATRAPQRAPVDHPPELLAELHSEKVTREIEQIRRGPTTSSYLWHFVGCVVFGIVFAAGTADGRDPNGSPAGRFLVFTVLAFVVVGLYARRKWSRLRAMAHALERERARTAVDL